MSPKKIEKLLSKAEDLVMMVAAAVADGEAEISTAGYQILTNVNNQVSDLIEEFQDADCDDDK